MGDCLLAGRSYDFRRAFVAHAVPEYEAERAAQQFLAFFQEPAFTYEASVLRALYGSTQGRLIDETDVDRIVDLVEASELPPPLALCRGRTLGWWLVTLYSSNATALRAAKTDGSVDWLDRITNVIVRIRRPRAPGLQYAPALDRGGIGGGDEDEEEEEGERDGLDAWRRQLPWNRVEPDRIRTRRRLGVALCRDPWLDTSLVGFKAVPVFSSGSRRRRSGYDALWADTLEELERADRDEPVAGGGETRLLIHPTAFAACIVCRYETSQPENVVVDLLRMMCSFPREYYFDVTWTDGALCDALVALLAGECVERNFVLYRRPLKLVHRARSFNLLSSPRLVVRDEAVGADLRRACLLRETLDSSTLSVTEDRFWTESLVSTVGGARDKLGPRLTRKHLCGTAVTWLDAATAVVYHDDATIRYEDDGDDEGRRASLWVSAQRGCVRLHGAGRSRLTAWRDPQSSEDDPDLFDRSKWTCAETVRLTANEQRCADAHAAATLFYDRHLNLLTVPKYNRRGFAHALLLLQSQNVGGPRRRERGGRRDVGSWLDRRLDDDDEDDDEEEKEDEDERDRTLRVVVEDTLSENELRALMEAVLGAVAPPVAVHWVCYVRRGSSHRRGDGTEEDRDEEDLGGFSESRVGRAYTLQYPRYRCAPITPRAELNWSDDPFGGAEPPGAPTGQTLRTVELPVVHETTLTRSGVGAWTPVEDYAPASALEEDAVKRTCLLLALKYPCRFSTETRQFLIGLPARWHDPTRPFLALTRVPMGLENRRDGHLNHYLRVPCHGEFPAALERVQKKNSSVAWGQSRSTVIMKGQTDGGVDYPDRLLEIVACHLLGHTTSAPLPAGDTERLLSRLGERLPLGLVPYPVNEASLVKSVLKELPYLDVLYDHMPVYSLYYDEAIVAGFVLSRLDEDGSGGGLDLTAAAGCLQTLMGALYPSPRSDWLLEWFLERTPHETDMAAYVVQTSRVKQLRDNVFVLERNTHSCFLNTADETPEVYAPVERALRAWMGDEPARAYARAFGPVYLLEEPAGTPLRRLGDARLWRVRERVPSQQTPVAVRSSDGVVLLFSGYAPCYVTRDGRRFFRWSSTKPLLGLFTTKTRHEVRKATPTTAGRDGEEHGAEDDAIDRGVEETAQKLFNTHLSLPYGTEYFIHRAFVETRFDARTMSARPRACVSLTRDADADEFHRSQPCRTVNAYVNHPVALWHSLTTDAEGVSVPTAAACSEALRLVTARVSDAYVRRKQPQGAVTHWHGGFAVGSESADAVLGLDEENRCSYRVEKVCARAHLRVEASFELYRDATLQLYAKKLFLWGASCFVRCFTVVRYQPLADAFRPHDVAWEDADTVTRLYERRAFLRVATRFTFNPDEYRAYAADGSELRDWPHDRELDEGCVLSKRARGDWAAHYTLLAPTRTGLLAALVLLLQQTADYVKVVLETEGLETLCVQYALEAAALFGYRPKRVLVLGRAAGLARTALLTRSSTLRLQRHLLNDDDSDSEDSARRIVLQLDGEPTGLMMDLMEATRGELQWIGAKVEEQPWDYRVVRTRDPDVVVLETDLGREWGRYGPADVDSGFLEAVRAAGVVRYRDPLNGTPELTWFERVSMADGDLRRLVRGLDADRLAYSYSAAELARASNALLDSNLTSYADALSLSERLARLTGDFERAFSLSADVATAQRLSGVNAYDRRALSASLDRAASVLQVVPVVTRLTAAYADAATAAATAASFAKTLRVTQSAETLRDGTLATTLRFAASTADEVNVRLPAVRLLWTSESNEWLSRAGLQVVVGARAELLPPTLERPYPLLTCERSLDSCVLTLWFAHGLCGEEPTLTARTSEEADFFLAAVRLFVATYDLVAGAEKATTFLHVNVAMGPTEVDSVRQAYVTRLTQPFVGDINGDTLYRFSVKRDSTAAGARSRAAERDRPPRALADLTKALKRWVLAAAEARPGARGLRDYWLQTFSAIEDDVPHSHRWLGRLLLSPYAPEQARPLEALSKYWNRYHIFLGWPR